MITFWLLFIAAFCSCSKDEFILLEQGRIIISGTVSNKDTNEAIEGVRITLNVFGDSRMDGTPVRESAVYSDSEGEYSIVIDGIKTKVNCMIVTDHEQYKEQSTTIMVNWTGTSYDEKNHTFFVNDCDFHLENKQ